MHPDDEPRGRRLKFSLHCVRQHAHVCGVQKFTGILHQRNSGPYMVTVDPPLVVLSRAAITAGHQPTITVDPNARYACMVVRCCRHP